MENIMVDVLLRRYVPLSILNVKLLGLKYMKDSNNNDDDFAQVYKTFENLTFDKFYRFNSYLFFFKLCVCNYSMHELLVREAY